MEFLLVRSGLSWFKLVVLTLLVPCIIDMSVASDVGRRKGKKPINVLLLLPMDNKYMFSYAHVFPALEIALEKLEANDSLLRDYYLHVRYNDSMCHEAVS